MAINLDPAQGVSTPLAGRLDRHDAEARQGRWMLELERATLSTNAKKQRGAAPRQDGDAPAQQAVLPPEGGVPGSPAEGRGVPDGQAAHDSSAERSMTDARSGGRGAIAAVAPVHGHAPAGAQASGWASGAGGTAAGGPAAAIAPGTPARAAAAVGSGEAGSIQALPAGQKVTAPPAALGQSAEPLPGNSTPAGFDPAMAGQGDGGAGSLADVAEFDKRLMHLFSGPDGMHAYIRDAELGAAQMRSIAVALGTELAAGGQPLATLTVNGKRISLAGKSAPGPAFDGGGAALAASDELAGPQSYLPSLTLARKDPSE